MNVFNVVGLFYVVWQILLSWLVCEITEQSAGILHWLVVLIDFFFESDHLLELVQALTLLFWRKMNRKVSGTDVVLFVFQFWLNLVTEINQHISMEGIDVIDWDSGVEFLKQGRAMVDGVGLFGITFVLPLRGDEVKSVRLFLFERVEENGVVIMFISCKGNSKEWRLWGWSFGFSSSVIETVLDGFFVIGHEFTFS